MTNLTDPIFHDEDKAREHLESMRWPNGPWCPHCGSENVKRLEGKSYTPGALYCRDCRKKFSVAVGTLFERSHIPLHKWVLAFHLMAASKKGMSAHQLHRMLDVTYKTAWFMAHRIREAMREPAGTGPLGGPNTVVEVDETFVGGKAKNRADGKVPTKEAVMALVERDGRVRSFHVASVNAKTLRPILTSQLDRKSYLMTDEAATTPARGKSSADTARSTTRSKSTFAAASGTHGRVVLRDPEARHLRRLSPRQPQASEALRRRIRLPLQRSRHLRRGPRQRRAAGHRGQAPHVSADWLAARSRKGRFRAGSFWLSWRRSAFSSIQCAESHWGPIRCWETIAVTVEEKQQLIWARGQAMAAMACVQQLCRVMQEHGIMTTEQLRDAISEALAMAETWNPDNALEREVARVIGLTIRQTFEDRRP